MSDTPKWTEKWTVVGPSMSANDNDGGRFYVVSGRLSILRSSREHAEETAKQLNYVDRLFALRKGGNG